MTDDRVQERRPKSGAFRDAPAFCKFPAISAVIIFQSDTIAEFFQHSCQHVAARARGRGDDDEALERRRRLVVIGTGQRHFVIVENHQYPNCSLKMRSSRLWPGSNSMCMV